MRTTAPLYLASQSPIRRSLLEMANIPFTIISQSADEKAIDWNQSPEIVARIIAQSKMEHALIPPGEAAQYCFVLTADTLCVDNTGTVHGKPVDVEQAIAMIKLWRSGCKVVTALCLDKKIWNNGAWLTHKRIERAVTSSLELLIPDQWIEEYLSKTKPLEIAGSVAIEGYGFQFVKSVHGSYSAILGLPMYELRDALTSLGFFSAFPAS